MQKFESPYRRLLDADVKFHAVLGQEDSREQRFYKLFNMNGQPYYTFSPARDVQFFALESTYMDTEQLRWLEEQLQASSSAWKIALLHHSVYSSGRRRGPDVSLRTKLEPLFLKHNVSVVLGAGDNFYERVVPQQQIAYFVVGAGGRVRQGELDTRSGLTAQAFDSDLTFMAAEIDIDRLSFQVISRGGQSVDSGRFPRRK